MSQKSFKVLNLNFVILHQVFFLFKNTLVSESLYFVSWKNLSKKELMEISIKVFQLQERFRSLNVSKCQDKLSQSPNY